MGRTKELLKELLIAFFEQHDTTKALFVLANNIHACGFANDVVIDGIDQAEKLLKSVIYQKEFTYYKLSIIEETEINERAAELVFELQYENIQLKYRVSAMSEETPEGEKLSIVYFFIITPAHTQTIFHDMQQKKEDEMRQKFLDTSISGGMMGYYFEDGLPCYFINYRMREYLGYQSEEEFLKDNNGMLENCIHPDERQSIVRQIEEEIRHKGEYQVNYRMKKKDGSYIWVHELGHLSDRHDDRDIIMCVCFDVTKEMKARKQIQKNEQMLEKVCKIANLFIFEVDIRKKRAFTGSYLQAVYQLAPVIEDFPESFIAMKLIHPEYENTYRNMVQELSIIEPEKTFDIKFINPKGSYGWMRFHWMVSEYENGEPIKAVGYARFIDFEMQQQARMDMERQKMLSGDKKLTAYSIINLSTFQVDECQDYQWQTGVRAGDSLSETLLKVDKAIFLEEDRKKFREIHDLESIKQRYQKGITSLETDLRFADPEGYMHWQRSILNVLANPDTGELYLYDYLYDIMAEKILEEFVEGAVQSEFDMIGVVAMDTGNFYHIDFEQKTPKVNTLKYERVCREYNEKNVIPEEQDLIPELISIEYVKKQMSLHPEGYVVKHRSHGPNHSLRYREICFSRLKNSDNICFCNVRDVTETISKENEKNQILSDALQRAEAAMMAKTDFLSQMSHDLRTPLNSIINMAVLAMDDIDKPMQLQSDLQKINIAGEFMLGLINDILDMNKIESNKMILNPGVYTHEEFCNYLEGIVLPLCVSKDVSFNWRKQEAPDIPLWVDKIRFNQIFFNVLSNAVKYTDAGGIVTFQENNVTVHDGVLSCDYLIQDNGIGIGQEFQKKMFEPFEREKTTEAFVGSGLGLTITKKLVELMNGTIRVESEENEGTKVFIHLDLTVATKEQLEANSNVYERIPERNSGVARILVVEDHPLNREIIIRLLEKERYLSETAENGQIAVNMVKKHENGYYQAILMDIRMPVMDGLTATKEIRSLKQADAKSIPIIAMTANAFDTDKEQSKEAGMNEHLSKPIEPKQLYTALATYIRKG